MRILIPNSSSPRNIGDQAMFLSTVASLRKDFPQAEITIHTFDSALWRSIAPEGFPSDFKESLYSWAAFAKRNSWSRIVRVAQLLLAYFGFDRLVSRQLRDLAADYHRADLIAFCGGGYLRSRPGFTQAVNLVMQLVPFYFANKSSAKKIIFPISFGPFAYAWQERLAANAVSSAQALIAREYISERILERNHVFASVAPDMAFLLTPATANYKPGEKFRVGLTLRHWLPADKQRDFEDNIVKAIEAVAHTVALEIVPIVQVSSAEFGDIDKAVLENVCARLVSAGVQVAPLREPTTVADALAEYSGLDMLIAMRTHSAVLAALQGTPIIAISYEHKTEGIMKMLGMEEYVLPAQDLSSESLGDLITKCHSLRASIKNKLTERIASMVKAVDFSRIFKYNIE